MMYKLTALTLVVALGACSSANSHMSETHTDHAHAHGSDCGHQMIAHNDHTDYLHDGHLHHMHDGHADEHVIDVTDVNPAGENPVSAEHHGDYMHTLAEAEHPVIPHGDHVDVLHDGHLHHIHGDHIDEHGPISG